MLDEMTRRNDSKFAIFYKYENPKMLFPFFISCYFIFFPNEFPGLVCIHALLGENNNKVARNEKTNEKTTRVFVFQKYGKF